MIIIYTTDNAPRLYGAFFGLSGALQCVRMRAGAENILKIFKKTIDFLIKTLRIRV